MATSGDSTTVFRLDQRESRTRTWFPKNWLTPAAVVFSVILLSLMTVGIQRITYQRFDIVEVTTDRHSMLIAGVEGDPWQYRVLSEFVVEGVRLVLQAVNFPNPTLSAYLGFRVLQNILIFSLAALYYRKLGLNTYTMLLGLSLLAWVMTQCLYGSNFAFNTYSDVLFYLAAALLILHGRLFWVIPLAGVAALNRETSGCIPLMLLAAQLLPWRGRKGWKGPVAIAAAALLLWTLAYVGVRLAYGPRDLVFVVGLEMIWYNLTLKANYVQLPATFGLLPFLALYAFRRWPQPLRAFFWAVVPLWFLIHPFTGIMAESRQFLVPIALVFIPGTLFGLARVSETRKAPQDAGDVAARPCLLAASPQEIGYSGDTPS